MVNIEPLRQETGDKEVITFFGLACRRPSYLGTLTYSLDSSTGSCN